MVKSYCIVALRNLLKHKGYSFINIAGLAIGMACAIMILLTIRENLSYDRFNTKADRIFRVLTIDRALGVSSQRVGITLPPMGPAMKQELPEVKEFVRLTTGGKQLLSYENKEIYAENIVFTDSTIFKVFDFPVVSGDPTTALKEPNTVVLTQDMAQRLFGNTNVVGKTIKVNNQTEVKITGIMADIPSTSHLKIDVLLSLYPTKDQPGFKQFLDSWQNISFITYVLLNNPSSAPGLLPKMEKIIRKNNVEKNFSVTLQPLKDVHLKSADILFDTNEKKSDIGYVYALSAIAVFVLLIAAFNFMNLTTARSADRAREVGLRKVVGADRNQLIIQYLGESVLLCCIAFLLAIGLVEALLPKVNSILDRHLVLDLTGDPVFVIGLILLALVIALLAGIYPAFVLSGFQPITVLKGSFKSSPHGNLLRKIIVVTQFTVSVTMIICTTIVSQQMRYIREKNPGYDRDQVVVLTLGSKQLQQGMQAFRNELLANPAVIHVGASGSLPGRTLGRNGVTPEGARKEDIWITSFLGVDENFFPTLGIQMAAGRNFSREFATDSTEAVIINEAAAHAFGWNNALGKEITIAQKTKVIGVVKDFHFASVRHKIEPLVIFYQPTGNVFMSVKVRTDHLAGTLSSIQNSWHKIYPNYPFEYTFLDEDFEKQYRDEANFATLTTSFTVLAIFIACLGLFGLVTFAAEQRTKEIGIRKVLGASLQNIVLLLSKDFLLLVLIAVACAVPLAYWAMHTWLKDFAYRIDISPWSFFLAGGVAVCIALFTVVFRAVRAALANPVTSLRYE